MLKYIIVMLICISPCSYLTSADELVVDANGTKINATSTSTDKDSGALIVEGGVGVEENVNVGGNVHVSGNLTVNGSGFNVLSSLATNQVTISAATALDNTAIGKLHIITGAQTYDVTLPSASANNGKLLGFIVSGTGSYSVIASAATINGDASYPLIQNDQLILYCDGAKWIILSGGTQVYAHYNTASAQNMPYASNVRIDYNSKQNDSHDAVTTGSNWVFTAPKSAVYTITASFHTNGAHGSLGWLWVNGAQKIRIGQALNGGQVIGTGELKLDQGDQLHYIGLAYANTTLVPGGTENNWIIIKSN